MIYYVRVIYTRNFFFKIRFSLLTRVCFSGIVIGHVPKTKKIDSFFLKGKKTLAEVVSKMVALDGFTFRVFETSDELRESLQARGFKIPKTAKSYRKMMVNFSKDVRRMQRAEIKDLVSKGERFCITFDEWTSLRNRRYLNVILHGAGSKIWNLGLIRIRRRATSERCLSLVEKRLKCFELSVESHIICILTDGCPTMTKIGKLCPTFQQLCYAHGLQLAVIDVLYKKEKNNGGGNNDDYESDSDDDEDAAGYEDDDSEVVENEEDEIDSENDEGDDESDGEGEEEHCGELKENLKPLISKVRKIVKIFKNSAVKNEILQRYVKSEFKHELVLLLDTKTRWSSLAKMLRRFYDLKNCIKKALVDINTTTTIEEWEIAHISDIMFSLEPIQAAVEALCRRDANLITADATLIFTLKTLQEQNSEISLALFHALNQRIQERRTETSSVLHFLHTNNDSALNDSDLDTSWASDVAEIFKAPTKAKLEIIVKDIILRLNGTNFMYPHVRQIFLILFRPYPLLNLYFFRKRNSK